MLAGREWYNPDRAIQSTCPLCVFIVLAYCFMWTVKLNKYLHTNVELNLPHHLNYVTALPCKMHSLTVQFFDSHCICISISGHIIVIRWHTHSSSIAISISCHLQRSYACFHAEMTPKLWGQRSSSTERSQVRLYRSNSWELPCSLL